MIARAPRTLLLLAFAALASAGACGSDVTGGGGGGGAAGGSSSTSSSGCQSSADCGPGGPVCLLGSGSCVPACDPMGLEPCAAGLVCDGCATSSCPMCDDCVAACVPAAPGACDHHDDCAQGEVCVYSSGTCAPACDSAMPSCPTPDLVCADCVTSSCPGCEDCVSACLPPPL